MKKLAAATLLLAVFAFTVTPVRATTLDELNKTVQSLQKQISSLQSQLSLALSAMRPSAAIISSGDASAVSAPTPVPAPAPVVVTPPTPTPAPTVVPAPTYVPAPVPAPVVAPTPAPLPSQAPTAPVLPSVSSAPTMTTTPSSPAAIAPAALGSTGANVTAIQNALIAGGYLKAPASGYFGSQTQAAVSAFQAANGLAVVGSVGPKTGALLGGHVFTGGGTLTNDATNVFVGNVTSISPAEPVTGTLWISTNYGYPDSTIPANTTHAKIGSFFLHNGTTESVNIANFIANFTTGGTGSPTNLTNMQVVVNGTPLGTPLAVVGTYNTLPLTTTVPSATVVSVELFANTGPATSGSVRSNLYSGGFGVTTGTAYNTGSPSGVSGQDIGFGPAAAPCAITSFSASPTIVAYGSTTTLSWTTTGCTSASIDTGIGSVPMSGTIASGSVCSATTFTLTANGLSGSVAQTTTVSVGPLHGWTSYCGSSGAHQWFSVSSDSMGQHLAAVDLGGTAGGYIYTSNNYGATWTNNGGSSGQHSWSSIASDLTGKYLVAGTFSSTSPDYIYTSNNYGATWTNNSGSSGARNWISVASDSTGKYLVAADQNSYVYTSSNYGITWTSNGGSSGVHEWGGVASDYSGKYLAATVRNADGIGGFGGGYIYTSNNYGVTWTTNGGSSGIAEWFGIASDSTGQHLAAVRNMGSLPSNLIYTSNDYGVTWTSNGGSSGAHSWQNIASDASGQHLLATAPEMPGSNVYTSNNYGVTWTAETGLGTPTSLWHGVASSADGTHLVAGTYGGFVWEKNP